MVGEPPAFALGRVGRVMLGAALLIALLRLPPQPAASNPTARAAAEKDHALGQAPHTRFPPRVRVTETSGGQHLNLFHLPPQLPTVLRACGRRMEKVHFRPNYGWAHILRYIFGCSAWSDAWSWLISSSSRVDRMMMNRDGSGPALPKVCGTPAGTEHRGAGPGDELSVLEPEPKRPGHDMPGLVVAVVDVQGATSRSVPSAGQSAITRVVPLTAWPSPLAGWGEMIIGVGAMR